MTIFKWNISKILQNFVHALGFTSVTDDWVGRKKVRPTIAAGVSFPWIAAFNLFLIYYVNLFLIYSFYIYSSTCIDLMAKFSCPHFVTRIILFMFWFLQIIKKWVLLSKTNMCVCHSNVYNSNQINGPLFSDVPECSEMITRLFPILKAIATVITSVFFT